MHRSLCHCRFCLRRARLSRKALVAAEPPPRARPPTRLTRRHEVGSAEVVKDILREKGQKVVDDVAVGLDPAYELVRGQALEADLPTLARLLATE